MAKGGTYDELRNVLAAGDACLLPFDVPGRTSATLLERPARVASGPAALAIDTDAFVLPCFTVRRRAHVEVDVFEPVDPADFGEPEPLLRHLGDIVSTEIGAHLPQFYPAELPTPERYEEHRRRVAQRAAKRERRAKKLAAHEEVKRRRAEKVAARQEAERRRADKLARRRESDRNKKEKIATREEALRRKTQKRERREAAERRKAEKAAAQSEGKRVSPSS
jgi:hypothetical protein